MVSSIAVLNNSFNQRGTMAGPSPLSDPSSNSKQNHQPHKDKKLPSSPIAPKRLYCDQSRTAVIDCVFLIAVICASGFLLYPYVSLCFVGVLEVVGVVFSIVKYEVCRSPVALLCLGLSLVIGLVGAWGIWKCLNPKCKKRNCRGLRNAAEIDIQIEAEDNMKNSSTSMVKDWTGKGIYRLAHEHYREIELELRKMAPTNGRAVLIFRKKCGCAIGKMVVAGPKVRKIKK